MKTYLQNSFKGFLNDFDMGFTRMDDGSLDDCNLQSGAVSGRRVFLNDPENQGCGS